MIATALNDETVINNSWNVSDKLWLALGMVLLLTGSLGCRNELNKVPIDGSVAPVQNRPVANLRIDLEVDTRDEHAIVHVTWKNLSATETCFFEPWQLFRSNLMEGSLLQLSESGRKLEFLGAMVKRRVSAEKDLVALAPGHSLQAQQDITTQYRFDSGTHVYSLAYSAFLQAGNPRKYALVSSQPANFTLVR